MEEARQYPALDGLTKLVIAISVGSLVVFVAAVVSLFAIGGQAFRVGLVAFFWLRFGLEVVRTILIARQGKKLVWPAINVILHLGIAVFCSWALHPWY